LRLTGVASWPFRLRGWAAEQPRAGVKHGPWGERALVLVHRRCPAPQPRPPYPNPLPEGEGIGRFFGR